MKVVVIGSTGQLAKCLKDIRPEWTYLSRRDVDLSKKLNLTFEADVIINAAAYTNVELAEDESELAHRVNGWAVGELAKYASSIKAHLVHISTDYIFSGNCPSTYSVTARVNPLNEYGKSKLLGERLCSEFASSYSIIRTSWVFSEYGKNFFKTMWGLSSRMEKLTVVNDQHGSPTYAYDLAAFIVEQTENKEWRTKETLHYTNHGYCTWYDFAKEIMKYSNLKCQVDPCDSSKFPTKAKRPKNSKLFKVHQSPDWQDAVKRCANKFKNLKG